MKPTIRIIIYMFTMFASLWILSLLGIRGSNVTLLTSVNCAFCQIIYAIKDKDDEHRS